MAQVKLGFRGLSVSDKVQRIGNHVICLTGNPFFPTPNPTVEELKAKGAALDAAYKAALDGGKALKASMRQRESEADAVISQLGAYVQNASGGDAEKIRSAGFEVRSLPSKMGELDPPINLQATTSKRAGEILLSWDSVAGRSSYTVEKSADGTTNWQPCGNNTRTNLAVQNLPSLAYTYFRVATVSPAGQSAWSETVRGLAS